MEEFINKLESSPKKTTTSPKGAEHNFTGGDEKQGVIEGSFSSQIFHLLGSSGQRVQWLRLYRIALFLYLYLYLFL